MDDSRAGGRVRFRHPSSFAKEHKSMHVAHIGATGKVGSKILEELLRRGHTVTAISRHPEKLTSEREVRLASGDITDPDQLASVLKGHDAVVTSATFVPGSSTEAGRCRDPQSGVKRWIAVGGAGSLEIAPGKLVKDSPGIPPEWMPAINEGSRHAEPAAWEPHLDWTFFSPAALIGPGERTGKFRLGRSVDHRAGRQELHFLRRLCDRSGGRTRAAAAHPQALHHRLLRR